MKVLWPFVFEIISCSTVYAEEIRKTGVGVTVFHINDRA